MRTRIDDIIRPLERALRDAYQADADLDDFVRSFGPGSVPGMTADLESDLLGACRMATGMMLTVESLRHRCAELRISRGDGIDPP